MLGAFPQNSVVYPVYAGDPIGFTGLPAILFINGLL